VWALLGPGDLVAIYSTTKGGDTIQVIGSIKVIAVGARRSVRSTVTDTAIPSTIMTLDADDTQTRKILQAQAGGTLTMAVLGKDPTG
jgi:Flp pilus assembly protein CpaB